MYHTDLEIIIDLGTRVPKARRSNVNVLTDLIKLLIMVIKTPRTDTL